MTYLGGKFANQKEISTFLELQRKKAISKK